MARQMKDSGIEWIGEIPEGWEISKIKYIGTYINGYAFKPEQWGNIGKPIIRIQDLTGSNNKPNYYNGEIDKKYLIRRGDILISWAATLSAFVWDKEEAYLNQHIFKAECNDNIDKEFFLWLITISMNNMENENKHGIMMQHLTTRVFGNFYVPLPNTYQQKRIAKHLNTIVKKIDSVIEKTKSSIEEYKKLKQSVITEAVTKGIRPNRQMKDSGIEWIGEIPEEWEKKKIKFLFSIKKDIAGQEGYTVLSITQKGIVPKDLSSNEGQLAANYSNYQIVKCGYFAMNHMDLLTGWVDISKYDGVTSPDYRVFILRDNEKSSKEYFLSMFQMLYFNRIFYGYGQGVSNFGRWRLQADKFKNIYVPVPPLHEQQEIISYLDRKIPKIDALIAKKEQLITELESYKKSLIYEYVTGKKEVAVEQ